MVAEAEVFDQVGHGAGGRGLPVPQGAVLTLLGQTLPDAGTRLLNLKRAFPVQVSPSVIFWFRNDKEKTGVEKASMPALYLSPQPRAHFKQDFRARKALKNHPVQPHFMDEKERLRAGM